MPHSPQKRTHNWLLEGFDCVPVYLHICVRVDRYVCACFTPIMA